LKIVHISTYDVKGGAARSAYRLHQGLLGLGHESAMVVRQKSSADAHVHECADARPDWREWELVQEKCIDENRTPISNTYFSLGAPGCDVSAHPAVQAADVIHLHWVTWFQSPMSILRLSILGKPMVWTLHDQRAFTGGCHFSAGCVRYENECGSCPQLQKDWFDLTRATVLDERDAMPISAVVCPSHWLADCAKRSAVFRAVDVSVIPYGIDTNIFRPQSKTTARDAIGLNRDAFWFLFGGDNMSIKRKGIDILVEAIRIADKTFRADVESGRVQFGSFGGGKTELPVAVKHFGRIKSDEQLAQVCAAADVLLLPSLEDNLPNVMIEALCCGTPVVAFAIGGIPDAVEDGVTGRLVRPGDAREFARAMIELAQDRQLSAKLSENCGRALPERYSLGRQAEAYVDVYERALATSLPATATGVPERRVREIFPSLVRLAQNRGRGRMAWRFLRWK
jgi:glycosyltransferase involved in cell wall biosynthesis